MEFVEGETLPESSWKAFTVPNYTSIKILRTENTKMMEDAHQESQVDHVWGMEDMKEIPEWKSVLCMQPGQMEVGKFPVPSEPIAAAPAPADSPYIHSPNAAQEPPVRNMSTSTASTSGSLELPPRPSTESEAAGSSTFVGAQQVRSCKSGTPFKKGSCY